MGKLRSIFITAVFTAGIYRACSIIEDYLPSNEPAKQQIEKNLGVLTLKDKDRYVGFRDDTFSYSDILFTVVVYGNENHKLIAQEFDSRKIGNQVKIFHLLPLEILKGRVKPESIDEIVISYKSQDDEGLSGSMTIKATPDKIGQYQSDYKAWQKFVNPPKPYRQIH